MSTPHDPFAFDAEFGDPNYVKSARDPNRRPETGPEWQRDGRPSDIPVTPGGDPSPFADEFATTGPGFHSLPDIAAIRELKTKRQWVSWKYAEKKKTNGETYLTKLPVCPHDNRPADVSKSWTWSEYDDAVSCSLHYSHAGVGYVLTGDDDISGHDLDKVRNPVTGRLDDWVQVIVDLAETYTEVSPSGRGVRMFWRGKLDKAITNDAAQVEIYSTKRYLTITGNRISGTPDSIGPAPKTLELLRARVETFKAVEAEAKAKAKNKAKGETRTKDEPGTEPPQDATASAEKGKGSEFWSNVKSAALANLGSWVPEIFANARFQPGTGAWRISSIDLGRDLEEDLSIHPDGIQDWGIRKGLTAIDLVIEHGGAPDAVAAASWLCEKMGASPEALGWNEDCDGDGWRFENSTFARQEQAAPDQPDETSGPDPAGAASPQPALSSDELPYHLARVPGLVGEIAGWITDTAIYPQPALSLGAALTVVGTAAGRRLAGPTRSGTHLYVIGLAPSGAGKDHPRAMIGVILAQAGMAACIGPSEFISMPAVYKFLNRAPLSVCAMDEFGAFLKRINSRKASGFEAQIGATLRVAWGSSFKPMPTPEWAGKSMGTIYAPALSIYGVSTLQEFYASLAGADVTNGVLNRFLQIETRIRPPERMPTVDPTLVPPSIIAGLKKIHVPITGALGIPHQEEKVPDHSKLDITPEAGQVRKELVLEIQAMGDADASLVSFLARTAENAIRLASIVAIGRGSMTVDAADMSWARAFTMWSTQRMAEGAGLYIADSDHQAMANDVKRSLKGKGKVARSTLLRALGHKYKARDLEGVLNLMIEAEEITIERGATTPKGGQPPRWYTLRT